MWKRKNKKKVSLEKEDFIIGAALLTGGIGVSWLLYDNFLVGALFLLAYRPVKNIYMKWKVSAEKKEIEKEFYDFLYYISTSLSLGRTMIQAMNEAGKNMEEIYGRDAAFVGSLKQMVRKNIESNVSESELFEAFATQSENEDIQDFFDVYKKCKVTGGNLIEAVNSASQIIREKIEIEREIKAMSSQSVLEGRIISVMPFAIIFFLKLTGPDYLQVMYESFGGRLIMTMTLVATVVSWILVEKFTKVKL